MIFRRFAVMTALVPLTATTAAATLAAPPVGADAGRPAAPTGEELRWTRCPAPAPAQGNGGRPAPLPDGTAWECATLKVPLDHARPGGERLPLALVRARARPGEGERRIGSLVLNFGGPGDSGVFTLPAMARKHYLKLHRRYDLVSFDPRGVGRSGGVRCLDGRAFDAWRRLDGTPDGPAEERALTGGFRAYAAACARHARAVLPYVGTENAARDLDLLRQALGEERLHYFGISYGTKLGGVYAHLFPHRVGRMVLDAVVDPTENAEQVALHQAKGFQRALGNFLRDCAGRRGCPAAGGRPPRRKGAEQDTRQAQRLRQAERRITRLITRLDARPLPTAGGRPLTQTQALYGVAAALYSREFWPYLRLALRSAIEDGKGDLLLFFADALHGRGDGGRYTSLQSANAAVNCADSSDRYTARDVRARLPKFRAASPVFGELLAWGLLQCADWPVAGAARGFDVSAPGAPPILVVGTTGDPATPYEGAATMAERLGVGVELVHQGEGHGAYGAGSACVDGTVNRFLLDGTVPANHTTCP
ncbi:Carboxylesterase A precursor [Nonomuraea coxensis DSM 45129]|uniref:Carboxylesterase A n=1 Tax=Nonomuraea coxensis DSM 45129 TaxID=1122611 RepID=A0ABX8U4W9_9ACTN|nr:alpha/beta hydrolase [Nonomuraea coxensis]QYC42461.1 Carboxylesterase A precursor [Nonomuraea coxensis DSM 45129]